MQSYMSIFWPIILVILLIASLGLVIYLAKKLLELEMKDFLYATIGGLGFTVAWLSISLLLNWESVLTTATAGGVAVFFAFLALRTYRKKIKRRP